jgi:hypothetical protein
MEDRRATSVTPAHSVAKGYRAEHRIDIDAPVDAVWEILEDFGDWGLWNPLYVETNGALRIGETINMSIVLPGLKPQKASATVTANIPKSLIEYHTRAMGGLTLAYRYIELHQTGPAACTVVNGEVMGGLVGPLLGRAVGAKVLQGMQAMNEALKKLTEIESVRAG